MTRVYIEKPIDSTKKLLDLISEFGKIVGNKVNIQKLKIFLYTNNEISERESRGGNPIYPGVNLTKEVKELCL